MPGCSFTNLILATVSCGAAFSSAFASQLFTRLLSLSFVILLLLWNVILKTKAAHEQGGESRVCERETC